MLRNIREEVKGMFTYFIVLIPPKSTGYVSLRGIKDNITISARGNLYLASLIISAYSATTFSTDFKEDRSFPPCQIK